MEKRVAGIDVSRKVADVHVKGENCTFANRPQGFRSLRKWLGDNGADRMAMESTGFSA